MIRNFLNNVLLLSATLFILTVFTTSCRAVERDETYLYTEAFKNRVNPLLYPIVMEFIQTAKKNNIDVNELTRIVAIRFVPDAKFRAEMDLDERTKGALAVTKLHYLGSVKWTIVEFQESLKGDPSLLRPIVFHELLHALGYDHPDDVCEWKGGKGIMCHVNNMSDNGYNTLIKRSMTQRYLDTLPQIP